MHGTNAKTTNRTTTTSEGIERYSLRGIDGKHILGFATLSAGLSCALRAERARAAVTLVDTLDGSLAWMSV